MNKDRIRNYAAHYLASLGYAAGDYGFVRQGRKMGLQVLVNANAKINGQPALRGDGKVDSPMAGAFVWQHMRSGMSKRAIDAALANIPRRGDARPVAPQRENESAVQLGMLH